MELLTGGKEVEEITLEGSQLYFDFVLSWLGTTYEKLTSPFF